MPKVRVLVNGRFGEGWRAGDIVNMDDIAVRVPLEEGVVELVSEKAAPKKEKVVEEPQVKELYNCGKCGEKHKEKKNAKCDRS